MKKLILLLSIPLLSVAYSCSDSIISEPIEQEKPMPASSLSDGFKISVDNATEIADSVLNRKSRPASRSGKIRDIKYVRSDISTLRAHGISDTVAYIINYPEGGFAIVSSDNRIEPILAYSDSGSFSTNNELAMANFVNRIGNFLYKRVLQTNSNDGVKRIETSDVPYYIYGPYVFGDLHGQGAFAKYIKQEKGESAVASSAQVAAATAMIHCKTPLFTYQGKTFNLWGIRGALERYKNHVLYPPYNPSSSKMPPIQSISFEQAVDQIAWLYYYIGEDIRASYKGNYTTASSYKAIKLLNEIGYQTPTTQNEYNTTDIISAVINRNIIYMYAWDILGNKNEHAWICDGCKYKFSISMTSADGKTSKVIEYYEPYLHCVWGWGGNGNGYYYGDIFTVSDSGSESEFETSDILYSPIKIEYDEN